MSVVIQPDFSEFHEGMRSLLTQLRNKAPLFRNWGEIIHNSTMERFRLEEAPDGTPWAPLAPATRRARLKRNGNAALTILRESGALAGSFHPKPSANRLAYGSNKVYAAIHHAGGKAGRGGKVTIPPRTILGLSQRDQHDFEQEAIWHLRGGK